MIPSLRVQTSFIETSCHPKLPHQRSSKRYFSRLGCIDVRDGCHSKCPLLSTEWGLIPPVRSWNFKSPQGVGGWELLIHSPATPYTHNLDIATNKVCLKCSQKHVPQNMKFFTTSFIETSCHPKLPHQRSSKRYFSRLGCIDVRDGCHSKCPLLSTTSGTSSRYARG